MTTYRVSVLAGLTILMGFVVLPLFIRALDWAIFHYIVYFNFIVRGAP